MVWTSRPEVRQWVAPIEATAQLSTEAYDTLAWDAIATGSFNEAERLARHGIEASSGPPSPGLSSCWYALALVAHRQGNQELTDQAMRTARTVGGDNTFRQAVMAAVSTWLLQSTTNEAAHDLRFAAEIAAQLDHLPLQSVTANFEAWEARRLGQLDKAEDLAEQALDLAHRAGLHQPEWMALNLTAIVHGDRNSPQTAHSFKAALQFAWNNRDWYACLTIIENYALWHAQSHQPEQAALLLGHIAEHHHTFQPMTRSLLNELQTDTETQAALDHSARLTRNELIAHALDGPVELRRNTSDPESTPNRRR